MNLSARLSRTHARPVWRRAGVGVLVVAATGLLLFLLRDAPVDAVLARLAALDPRLLGMAALGWLGSYGLRAWRLRQEWTAVQPVPFGRCLRLVLTHNAAVLLLPLRSGEAGYVWLVHRQWGVGLSQAARSLLWLRWQDAVVLGSAALALFAPLPIVARLALGALALVAGIAAAPMASRLAARLWPRLRLPRLLGVLGDAPPDASGWALSAANWGLRLTVVAVLLGALTGVDSVAAVTAALGGELGAALPLQGPAGLGNYELGILWGAQHGGPPPASATHFDELVAAGFAVHLFCLAVGLVSAALAQGLGPLTALSAPDPARCPSRP